MPPNLLKWNIWKPQVGFHTPDHFFPLFLPDEGYVTILNASYHIISFHKSNIEWHTAYYCVRIVHKGLDYALRVKNGFLTIYTTENGIGASMNLNPWPRNIRKLATSIVNIIKLFEISNIHDS